MLETTELNVDAEVQTLIWKMKNKAKKFGSASQKGFILFGVCPGKPFINRR